MKVSKNSPVGFEFMIDGSGDRFTVVDGGVEQWSALTEKTYLLPWGSEEIKRELGDKDAWEPKVWGRKLGGFIGGSPVWE